MTYFYGRRQGNGCEIQFRALLYAREVLISRTVAHKKINELMSNFFCDLLANKICIVYRVTDEKPLMLYPAYFLSDLNK
jgi:hypothetical protein